MNIAIVRRADGSIEYYYVGTRAYNTPASYFGMRIYCAQNDKSLLISSRYPRGWCLVCYIMENKYLFTVNYFNIWMLYWKTGARRFQRLNRREFHFSHILTLAMTNLVTTYDKKTKIISIRMLNIPSL